MNDNASTLFPPEQSKEWKEDCMKWRGRVLTGKYWHWCQDWDFLPVDETTPEWEGCSCSFNSPPSRP